jgi:hypothetical protein
MIQLYDARQNADGTWRVIVLATGETAYLNGVPLARLTVEEADTRSTS